MDIELKEIRGKESDVILKCFNEKDKLKCKGLRAFKNVDYDLVEKFLDVVNVVEGKRPVIYRKNGDSTTAMSYFPIYTSHTEEGEFLFNSRPEPCIIIDSELKLSEKTKEYLIFLECARLIGQRIGYFTNENRREYMYFAPYSKDFSARTAMQDQFLVDELGLALSFYKTDFEEKMKFLDAYSKIVLKRLKEFYTKMKRLDKKYHFMSDQERRLYDKLYEMRKTNINLFNLGMVTSSPLCKKLTDYVYIRKCEKEAKMEELKNTTTETSNVTE